MSRPRARRPAPPPASSPRWRPSVDLALAVAVAATFVVPPLLVTPDTKEAFRLVKTLAAGWLGLLSVVIAAWTLGARERVAARDLLRRPAALAILPLTLVVAAGALTTAHPAHFHAAVADFAIGAACVLAWSLAIDPSRLHALLRWTIPPAVLVAALGLDQALGLVGLLDRLRVVAATERLSITSTLGNPGDVGVMMVLPLVTAVARMPDSAPRVRALLGAATAVMAAAVLATQTLSAVVAVVAALAAWAVLRAEARRRAVLRLALLVALLAATTAAVPALRDRVSAKVGALAAGDVNAVLTGRLDGWRAAAWMLAEQPWTGVGHGAFRARFLDARLALQERGVRFFAQQHQVMFATPHNEALSVAAEQGWPGVLALAWAVGVLAWCLRRIPERAASAEATAGALALAVLCLTWFPFHVAAAAWPWLLWLAWVFRAGEPRA